MAIGPRGFASSAMSRSCCALIPAQHVTRFLGQNRPYPSACGLLHVGRLRRSRRDREGEPHVPALGAVLGLELPVALEVQIALIVLVQRDDVADLRPDAEHPRLEAADAVARAAVTGELLVGVADQADLQLLGDELR